METVSARQKFCPRCEQTLSIDDFGIARTRYDGRASHCRPCFREYRKEHYRANPEPYKARAKAHRNRMAEMIRSLKDAPCTDCGGRFPYYVMQWDHVGTDKVNEISRMRSSSVEVIMAEIAKCELVCANCHASRTHSRLSKSL